MSEKVLQDIKKICDDEKYNDCELSKQIKDILFCNGKLNLKKIRDLLSCHFTIEDYQRGYKWTKRQVSDLLNDIDNFNPDNESFYCLQPLVVKKTKDEKWEVIDGQQRLTTIYIILKYLEEPSFQLDYRTRESSEKFLEDIAILKSVPTTWNEYKTAEVDNIDNYHFFNAFITIQEWFKSKGKNDNEKNGFSECWRDKLLSKTKFIWYEIGNDDDIIDTFMRLNSGKIPLTNSELIRALFLHSSASKDDSATVRYHKQLKIAQEWDWIERELHNDDFWGFITLNNPFKKSYPNRIEFLFDLIENGDAHKHEDHYSTYRMYEQKIIEQQEDIEKLWQEIKTLYYRFHEWYVDDEIYHLLGYLWLIKQFSVLKAIDSANNKCQSDLVNELKLKIKDILLQCSLKSELDNENNKDAFLALSYGEHNDKLLNCLVLFNIHTHMLENTRCPFFNYKNCSWSLEHIHAQNSKDLSDSEWEKWAGDISDLDSELKALQNSFVPNTPISKRKERFDDKIKELYGNPQDYMHTIANLALLSRDANSALNNSIFPDKRSMIIKFINENKHFIPPATRNVFLKYYSNELVQTKCWDHNDCKAYMAALQECFTYYLEEN
jgi:uncharacterized protein with ParB-like and HNH nuclease domain